MPEEVHRGSVEDGEVEEVPLGDLSHFYRTHHRVGEHHNYKLVDVSSHNMDWCPALQSHDTVIYLRADGTFGPDDPISWPQLYHQDVSHLPSIPVSDPDENSLVGIFRRGLRANQVTQTDDWDGNHRVCRLSEETVSELEPRVGSFIKEVQDFLQTRRGHLRLLYLKRSLENFFPGFLKKKDTLFRLRIVFGLVSRLYFEARGYIDYHAKYKPLLDSGENQVVNPNLIGVLTDEKRVRNKYQQMGIPVWYIRTQDQVSGDTQTSVKRVVPRIYQSRPMWPSDCFRDDGFSREERAMHKGQTDMSKFLKAVDEWLKPKLLDLLDDKSRKRRRVEQEDGEIRKPSDRVSINAHIESKNIQNFELWEKLEPRATDPWVYVAAKYASIPLDGAQHQPRFVPQIDLTTGVNSLVKAKEFVAVWKLIRLCWVHEAFMHRKPPDFSTRKAWKSFASGTFTGPPKNLQNEASIARIRFAEFMHIRQVISLERKSVVFYKGDTPGTIEDKVPIHMVRDTVCELVDLAFFFDLFEIEYHRTYDSPVEIEDRLQVVMYPSSFRNPERIPRSTLTERATWLVKVRDFVSPWQKKKPDGFFAPLSDPPTDREVRLLETAVAEVYCSNVTYVLRRHPVLPRYN